MSDELFEKAAEAICDADVDKAEEIAQTALDEGIDPLKMIEKGYTAGIKEVGRLFDRGELFLPQLMGCAEAMKKASGILQEAAAKEDAAAGESIKIVLGTVQGDVHDIGKGIVASILEANGIEVFDLGTDVPIEDFITKAKEVDADIIGTSALLTTTMGANEELLEILEEENLRDEFDLVVGGGPVTKRFAEKIGADGYAEDANEAVNKIKELAD
ncbi:methyltransferase cognate corrinoid protein [Acetohalobium arabaticum]|uniref:Trimethylamine corrinoid protein n=1 Tax=Acetohalobium arabaticum (strain ATCC 49924 / DSM 5501 / Z-7288) TaxID=574087 RepID=D9QQJ5_ACEAZ|nr:methyltransferase cognate corrinoid protein [Acetohalobium arabaticum]ADL12786.1 trimethylamine corrinoid protein [Acetohalobium arabaticum DSM 5501]